MHLVLPRTKTDSQERLHEIVAAFTPSVRRMCPHLSSDTLRALVERMAHRQLAAEERQARRGARFAPPRRMLARSSAAPLLRAVS